MIARIGDYQLTRALPQAMRGIFELEATHVLLPRKAIVRVAAEDRAPQLVREASILETVKYPGVPRVFECGVLADQRPWIAYEAVEGPTLAATMLERTFGPAEVLVLLRDLAEILHHAHTRGIAHARLGPELIVCGPHGIYITGWGTADVEREPRHDLHALGAMLSYTMAAPIPRAIAMLLDRMTSKIDLVQPTASEVRAEAIRLLDNLDIEEVEIELVELSEPISVGGYS